MSTHSRRRSTAASLVSLAVAGAVLAGPPAQAADLGPASSGAQPRVSGTVQVLVGEKGQKDQYWLETDQGPAVRLADGFVAEPLSRVSATLSVPTKSGETTEQALTRAGSSGARVKVLDANVQTPAATTKGLRHRTYVAYASNLGGLSASMSSVLARVDQAQRYWRKESRGRVSAWAKPTRAKKFRTSTTSVSSGCGLGGDDFFNFTREAGRKAFPGVDFSGRKPNHLVVVVPGACTASGVVGRATLGTGFGSGGPMVLSSREDYAGATKFTAAHEYGHNFSFHHANTEGQAYGDAYEVMGSVHGDTPILGASYRAQNGILTSGEVVGVQSGATVAINKISSRTGRRAARFVNPDNGAQCFVEYRDGGGDDSRSAYAAGWSGYGNTYRTGVTVTCDDLALPGHQLQRSTAGTVGLRAGETWRNGSGRFQVRVNSVGTTASITATANPGPALNRGAVVVRPAPALEGSEVRVAGFDTAIAGARVAWIVNGKVVDRSVGGYWYAPLKVAGKKVKARATLYAPGRSPVTVTSKAFKVSLAKFYVGTSQRYVRIKGTAKVGRKLTAQSPLWIGADYRQPAGMRVKYQWLRNGRKIKGATGRTYRLKAADRGKHIQVKDAPRAPKFRTNYWSRSASKRVR